MHITGSRVLLQQEIYSLKDALRFGCKIHPRGMHMRALDIDLSSGGQFLFCAAQ